MTYRYVIGMDVGKYFHHACVLDEHGTQVLSKQVNQHETSLRELFASFIGKVDQSHDVLVVVDQPDNADSAKPESTSSLDAIGHGIQKPSLKPCSQRLPAKQCRYLGRNTPNSVLRCQPLMLLRKRSTARKSRTKYSP